METLEFIKPFAGKNIGYTTSNLNHQLSKKLIREGIAVVVDSKKSVKKETKKVNKKDDNPDNKNESAHPKTENKQKRTGRKPKKQ